MADERDTRAEQQGDGQPENQRELDDLSSGAALSRRPRAGAGDGAGEGTGDGVRDDTRRDGGKGGTSDAGTAADDAARAAAHRRGLSDDLARRATRSSELEQDL